MEAFEWMAWTGPSATFFAVIFAILVGMTVWDLRSPSVPRRGFLPLETTRGDRLFIGLLGSAYVNLLWIGVTTLSPWYSLAMAVVLLALVMRYG